MAPLTSFGAGIVVRHAADGVDTVTVQVEDADTLERTYTMDSTHPQRDGWPQQVVFEERADQPSGTAGSTGGVGPVRPRRPRT